jgi:broad specificity phosphatase PhoE
MDLLLGPQMLVFIRHGESLRNKYGHSPFLPEKPSAVQELLRRITDHGMPITETGHMQARLTGQGLQKRFGTPNALFYSDYLRTMQTCEEILAAYGDKQKKKICLSPEELCRERCLGPVHNMTYNEAKKIFGDIDRLDRRQSEFNYRPPQGESLEDVTARARSFLSVILQMGVYYKTVFVVSHYRFIQCAMWFLSGTLELSYNDIFHSNKMRLPNCGIVVYKFDKELRRMVLVEHGTTFYNQ